MKSSEVKELSTKELEEKLEVQQLNYDKMRLNHAVSPLENPMKIKYARKVIARLKTELRSRHLNELKK
jgi:large subunit ribosomal protein L29